MTAKKEDSKKIEEDKNPTFKVTEIKQDLRRKEPPLVDLKVSNPITYLKSWWKRIIGNEGIDFRFRIRPLTAIAISIIVVTVSMGIGKFVFPFKIPFFVYTSRISPTPTPNLLRQTAFSGTLRTDSAERYYLLTSTSEAITLNVPENIDLSTLIGRRILATGSYHPDTRTLEVSDALDLEVLPKEAESIPTTTLSPEATPFISPIPATEEDFEVATPSSFL
jgi:hypothetical protein